MSKQKNLIEASQNVTFDTSGNVGIGTSSPTGGNSVLTIKNVNGSGSQINFQNAAATDAYIGLSGDSNGDLIHYLGAANNSLFYTSGSERMRIDSSGNLLVGQSTASDNATGIYAAGSGRLSITRDSNLSLRLNRLNTDGDIIRLAKDGSTVGSIAVDGNRLSFVSDNGSTGGGLKMTSAYIAPTNRAGGLIDNVLDCGAASARFDDIRASNSTIVTSDQNEKQQIASLTTAEITAAKAISQLFKTFKWNSAVTAKGDAARTHTGVIAQEVETAMTDAGLDAGDYAFFISDTWWEADGDTYDTAEEAPEGATERTRKGIRYPELLSFVGAATEQRLADIETRLTALEAV